MVDTADCWLKLMNVFVNWRNICTEFVAGCMLEKIFLTKYCKLLIADWRIFLIRSTKVRCTVEKLLIADCTVEKILQK